MARWAESCSSTFPWQKVKSICLGGLGKEWWAAACAFVHYLLITVWVCFCVFNIERADSNCGVWTAPFETDLRSQFFFFALFSLLDKINFYWSSEKGIDVLAAASKRQSNIISGPVHYLFLFSPLCPITPRFNPSIKAEIGFLFPFEWTRQRAALVFAKLWSEANDQTAQWENSR